ncbi:MAG TPA: NADH-quinone oxidoreductase subunit NuoK [Ferruginibacter sp.]|jgi:NADH-quinone oxidoreductase subunit K|nr:NADH-quinone oxidoreductase subunit NuoK [Ferruginibacter sp.]
MPIYNYIVLAIILFCIGVIGVLTRRNAIIIFMCVELMLNSVNLLLVAFSKMHNVEFAVINPTLASDAQIFVFFIMVVAAAEVTVGLAIIVMLYRNTHSVDVNFLNRLKN